MKIIEIEKEIKVIYKRRCQAKIHESSRTMEEFLCGCKDNIIQYITTVRKYTTVVYVIHNVENKLHKTFVWNVSVHVRASGC